MNAQIKTAANVLPYRSDFFCEAAHEPLKEAKLLNRKIRWMGQNATHGVIALLRSLMRAEALAAVKAARCHHFHRFYS